MQAGASGGQVPEAGRNFTDYNRPSFAEASKDKLHRFELISGKKVQKESESADNC